MISHVKIWAEIFWNTARERKKAAVGRKMNEL